jgi:hypothetical protein
MGLAQLSEDYCGVDGFIQKPFRVDAFSEELGKAEIATRLKTQQRVSLRSSAKKIQFINSLAARTSSKRLGLAANSSRGLGKVALNPSLRESSQTSTG